MNKSTTAIIMESFIRPFATLVAASCAGFFGARYLAGNNVPGNWMFLVGLNAALCIKYVDITYRKLMMQQAHDEHTWFTQHGHRVLAMASLVALYYLFRIDNVSTGKSLIIACAMYGALMYSNNKALKPIESEENYE